MTTVLIRRGAFVAALLLLGQLLGAAPARADDDFFGSNARFDPAVPAPAAVLGHAIGARPARVEAITGYLKLLGARSPRVKAEVIGRSFEGREIVLLAISSPANLARLDEIRRQRIARIETGAAPRDPAAAPLIVWLNYGVHGAEASGLEAVVPTAYWLAASEDPEVAGWLEKAVILLVAPFNPDGHARRVDWVERWSGAVANPDPQHFLHELWIDARTNHYGFDLNRQWLLLTQPESRAWQAAWQRWRPHVSADFHEMGRTSSYYFHPGAPSRRNPLIPEALRRFADRIADAHRAALDATGRLYYSEESFDNFYPGKGSTYPQLNGGVGFLFEAATANGGLVETPEGLRSLRDNVRTHFLTSLSTIRGAVALKDELLAYERDWAAETAALARADAVKADVVHGGDPRVLADFASVLTAHGIRVHRLARTLTLDGETFPAGTSLIIPRDQPQYRMVATLFDRVREFSDSIFYDVSAWTLPDAYGLAHGQVTGRRFDPDLLGAAVSDAEELLPEPPAPPENAYGYLVDWRDLAAARAAFRLLDAGVEVYGAMREFTAPLVGGGTAAYPAGTLFVPARGNQEGRRRAHALLTELSRKLRLPVAAVASGHTPDAGRDFGARQSFAPLARPRVLLAVEDGLQRYEWGAVWFLLDRRLGIPVTMMPLSAIPGRDLRAYTHLVLVGGRSPALDDRAKAALERWVRAGGTLVAFKQQAVWAARQWLAPEEKADKPERNGADGDADGAVPRLAYAEMPRWLAERQIGGAIFESLVDRTHPLAFGYGRDRIASMKNTTLVLPAPRHPFAAVAVYDGKEPLISGFASDENLRRIAGTPMLLADGLGRGRLVLFADEPTFRATFRGTERLFVNSLFFAPVIAVPRGE
ncbi:MAG: peptidase M14 [Rhodothalassiaceae bacterium]|nr:MAG: peptidase M14 [Rhodothalassiaceae bacterium]